MEELRVSSLEGSYPKTKIRIFPIDIKPSVCIMRDVRTPQDWVQTSEICINTSLLLTDEGGSLLNGDIEVSFHEHRPPKNAKLLSIQDG